MRTLRPCLVIVFAVLLATVSCVVQKRITSNSLEFLYPAGTATVEPSDVALQLPVRVGVAFAPTSSQWQDSFTEPQKQALLEQVATAFSEREGLAAVQTIPSSFLRTGGGFENLDRLVSAFGIDVITLLSYDQFQFSDTTRKSWAYWTIVGAYLVKGEKNETRTLLDAAIVHIPSRALLFTASGQSTITGKATPIDVQRELREGSEAGFEEATRDLTVNLEQALVVFEEQAATGTIRGQGTPAIAMYDEGGEQVSPGGGGGAGAIGGWELAVIAALATAAFRARRPA